MTSVRQGFTTKSRKPNLIANFYAASEITLVGGQRDRQVEGHTDRLADWWETRQYWCVDLMHELNRTHTQREIDRKE